MSVLEILFTVIIIWVNYGLNVAVQHGRVRVSDLRQSATLNQSINQSINHLFAHSTSSSETTRASRLDKQDSQAPGVLMAALIKHTKFPKTVIKQVQMSKMKTIKWPTTE